MHLNRNAEISSALCCLRTFKQAYKEENGAITIGDIKDLISKIDLLEDCLKKQKDVPANEKRCFTLFGKDKWIKRCGSCGALMERGKFCSECGQKNLLIKG